MGSARRGAARVFPDQRLFLLGEYRLRYRMARKNLRLKFALLETFDTLSAASLALGMNNSDLSRLVSGWRKPTDAQRKKFERVFGKKNVTKMFDKVS
jgi:hypothetical protein